MTKNSYWMAHEASHVALGIFDYVGAEAKAADSEPFAYLVGWAFDCLDKVRKYKDYGKEGKKEMGAPQEGDTKVETNSN